MGTYYHLDLFLVRHGITDWNLQKRYLGHTDKGMNQSKINDLVPLKTYINNRTFDHVFSSDLRRCLETLAFINEGCSFKTDKRLREYYFGQWEGKTYDELKENPAYREWINDWEAHTPPEGESAEMFKSRIEDFLNDLLDQVESIETENRQRILIVTHGGVIRFFLSQFIESDSFWSWKVKHGHGVQMSLTYEEGEWTCSSLSVVPTLESEKL